jgi:hypothetical protein
MAKCVIMPFIKSDNKPQISLILSKRRMIMFKKLFLITSLFILFFFHPVPQPT